MPFMATHNIEIDAIRRLADAVHAQTGHATKVGVGDCAQGEFRVTLYSPGHSYIFKGTIRECYCYLNGWLHATKEDQ